ncbi:MAG: E3 ubiquitin-protein ligase SlrP [Candidatus Anoxychlamydiales bacterium]|nr:E3 ubiquitin-protein ligase SlrP [Candidatus Anoxychlamydiales bacterium]
MTFRLVRRRSSLETFTKTNHFDSLPDELKMKILSHIVNNIKQLLQVGLVSNEWLRLTRDSIFWKKHIASIIGLKGTNFDTFRKEIKLVYTLAQVFQIIKPRNSARKRNSVFYKILHVFGLKNREGLDSLFEVQKIKELKKETDRINIEAHGIEILWQEIQNQAMPVDDLSYPNFDELKDIEDKTLIIKKFNEWIEVNKDKIILHKLDLSNKKIKYLSPAICKITTIKKLNISNNALTFLPENLGNLKNLKILQLKQNKLEKIPITISKLKKLKILDLFDNKLNSIPNEVALLKDLIALSLGKNMLQSLPDTLKDLPRLQKLHIYCNNFTHRPTVLKELEKKGIEIIIRV